MNRILAAAASIAALSLAVTAHAKETDPKAQATAQAHESSAQQNRMKACNTEAREKNLKGDERKAFMSSCLKGQKAH